MKTTLNKIRKHSPCTDGWEKLLSYLGKTKADDEEISVLTILDSNGLDDAMWCLRAVEGRDKEIRLFAVWCARQVQNLMTDQRSLDALDVAERFANGEATEAARVAARDAATEAARAADKAARAAADAARVAADAAVAAVATEAARVAAEAARAAWVAWYASRAADEAAYWAADEAAYWVAAEAAWAAMAAAHTNAMDEMRQRQEAELRRICE